MSAIEQITAHLEMVDLIDACLQSFKLRYIELRDKQVQSIEEKKKKVKLKLERQKVKSELPQKKP